MKTSIFLILILIGLVFVSFDFGMNQQAVVYAQATFGRGPNCSGRGLCNLDASDTQNSVGGVDNKLYIDSLGRMCMDIDKSAISVIVAEQQFVNDSFYIDAFFTIPTTITTALLMPQDSKIAPGYYPVDETSSRFLITF